MYFLVCVPNECPNDLDTTFFGTKNAFIPYKRVCDIQKRVYGVKMEVEVWAGVSYVV